jgi:peptidoglycan/xylan/chitin deacetylase (PgdA/CDA1 family)
VLGAVVGAGLLTGCDATSSGRGSGGAAGTPSGPTTAAPTGPAAATTPAGTPVPPATATASGGPASVPVAAGPDITHGPAGVPRVALTFHGAGDHTLLTRMLAALAEAGAQVTVLAIGEWLAGEPAMARQILDGGHELGNHTWSHRTMPSLRPADLRPEIDRAAAELTTLTGSRGRWFRPSGTPHSTAAIRRAAVAAGYGACLGYDVDPMDYADPGAGAVLARFAAAVRAGSIVSLHLGHPGTVQAMPAMLGLLHRRGLAAVSVTTLLGSR